MTSPTTFPPTVILINAVMLNQALITLKENLQKILQRPLQDMDMAQFVINLACDAEITGENNLIEVIFVHDNSIRKLKYCTPCDLNSELDAVAFREKLGEFHFTSVSPDGMIMEEALFLDLLNIIGNSADVKNLLVFPFEGDCAEETAAILSQIKRKKITMFSVTRPKIQEGFTWRQLTFPIMQALGITGEELDPFID